MALLTCSDVTFSYEGIPVLTDVNFTLEAGSYLCIVGENGSGKSTLVKGLLHLKNPPAFPAVLHKGRQRGRAPQYGASRPPSIKETMLP